ncbi:urease accessory protein UreH domain-containing protein [Anaerosacchariphilus polymeriproducens]|uniref:Heavy metal transporter n=1 Tax=Anaerosacchariphilus polymeriproducens TaxID=1812858 RepID=A0A371AR08_9FIRM|nr:sulfite exporter TauE/SafE family protein [Anaerosacchariphilus polymeriproducens]RDU22015.1 heavy metal transporter [Anaerosacchariphilus polymeriproducens]
MKQNIKNELLQIEGMTCINCEHRIETALKNTKGIVNAKADYTKNTVYVTYDANVINLNNIRKVIEDAGYQIIKTNEKVNYKNKYIQVAGILLLILALQTIIGRMGGFQIFNYFPQATEGMGYGMLFIIGLLTSVHCIAMCGGINLSQCASYKVNTTKKNDLRPSFLYNLGRIISYTVIGGIVGSLGSVVSLSGTGKGIITLLAGGFMIIMGLNMLNVFPWLRKINPHMPKFFAIKINEQKKSNSPLYIGLLNGLMPCGPLQAMQIYALSTGSPIKGAISMLLFSLGTVPLMFGFGALSSILTKKFTSKMMTISSILVILLGISMFQSGMALSGYAMPLSTKISNNLKSTSELFSDEKSTSATAEIVDGQQLVTTTLSSGSYEPITVQTGIPVKWTIKADANSINGCNNEIIIPEYNIQKELVPGENIIEFTPKESGTIPYSCWMGMIRSQISVYDNLEDQSQPLPQADTSQLPSCCN